MRKKLLMRFIKLNFTTAFLLAFFILPHSPAFAVATGLGDITATPEGIADWFVNSLAAKIAIGIALILVMFGGVKIIASGGDPKALDEGKKTITSALLGLIVIFLSVLLYDTIRVKLGLSAYIK